MPNTQTTVQTNKQFTINYRDAARGLLIAVLTSVLGVIYGAIFQGGFANIDWNKVLEFAALSGLSYLIKNYFTPSEIVINNPPQEEIEAVKKNKSEVIITKPTV